MGETLLLVFFLLLAPQTSSRNPTLEIRVPVLTNDPETVPLVAGGEATAVCAVTAVGIESEYELKGKLTNASPKPILAFEAVVDLDLGYAAGVRSVEHFDSFFSGDLLMPGSSTDIRIGRAKGVIPWDGREHPANINDIPPPKNPHAVVRVMYVQFADGSTFGKSGWGDALPVQRKSLVSIINRLLLANDDENDKAFSLTIEGELNQPNLSQDSLLFLSELRDRLRQKGRHDAAQYLQDLLRNIPKYDGQLNLGK
jgi:hypothetical protein